MTTQNDTPQQAVGYTRFQMKNTLGLAEESIDQEERIVRGYRVIERGEASGHAMWVDETMLDQVVTAGNASKPPIKTRWTHPGLCSDGLGKFLGRAKNFRRDGDMVRADLHFSDTTAKSPEFRKDPAEYLMLLAEEDPDAFATSIVFMPDFGAEERHRAEHTDEDGNFNSPDPENDNDYPHARVAELRASDVVDEGAAVGGFLSAGQESASRAERALDYLMGESDQAPDDVFGGMNADRAKQFFDSYMDRHNLAVVSIVSDNEEDDEMSDEEKTEGKEMDTGADQGEETPQAASLSELREEFDDSDFVIECAEEGLSLLAAKAKHADRLEEQLQDRDAEIESLQERAEKLESDMDEIREQLLDGENARKHGSEPDTQPDLYELAKQRQKEEDISYEEAFRQVSKEHREGYDKMRRERMG